MKNPQIKPKDLDKKIISVLEGDFTDKDILWILQQDGYITKSDNGKMQLGGRTLYIRSLVSKPKLTLRGYLLLQEIKGKYGFLNNLKSSFLNFSGWLVAGFTSKEIIIYIIKFFEK